MLKTTPKNGAPSLSKKRVKTVLVSIAAAGLTSFGTASAEDGASTSRTLFDDIVWHEVAKGRALAAVKGDFKTSAHVKLIKFDAGIKTGPHMHTHGYVGVLLKGTARHYEPGKPETKTVLPVGSHWTIPAGVVHISECLEGSECIFVTQSDGAFDLIPAK